MKSATIPSFFILFVHCVGKYKQLLSVSAQNTLIHLYFQRIKIQLRESDPVGDAVITFDTVVMQ